MLVTEVDGLRDDGFPSFTRACYDKGDERVAIIE